MTLVGQKNLIYIEKEYCNIGLKPHKVDVDVLMKVTK